MFWRFFFCISFICDTSRHVIKMCVVGCRDSNLTPCCVMGVGGKWESERERRRRNDFAASRSEHFDTLINHSRGRNLNISSNLTFQNIQYFSHSHFGADYIYSCNGSCYTSHILIARWGNWRLSSREWGRNDDLRYIHETSLSGSLATMSLVISKQQLWVAYKVGEITDFGECFSFQFPVQLTTRHSTVSTHTHVSCQASSCCPPSSASNSFSFTQQDDTTHSCEEIISPLSLSTRWSARKNLVQVHKDKWQLR